MAKQWKNTNSLARNRRLAPPHVAQVLAENYPPLPHNHQMTNDQRRGALLTPDH